jgi:hypothetical protein
MGNWSARVREVDMLDRSKGANNRWNQVFFITLISFLLALAQFRLTLLVMGDQYEGSVDAALGVIQGHPHWIFFQSRLLGPYCVKFISLFVGDFLVAHSVFVILMITVSGILIFLLVHRESGRDAAWSAFFLLSLLFALCNNKRWLYAWDYWDVILFLLFTYFVLSEKDLVWFLALFSIAIFNRESAFYIAFWMMLDPVVKHFVRKNSSQFNWKMFISGVGAAAAGLLIVASLRHLLLVEETMVKFSDRAPESHFHFQLWGSITYVKSVILTPTPDLVIPVFLLTVLMLALLVAWRDPRRFAALGLTYGALTASIFLFGFLSETRLMLELVPFVAMGQSFFRKEYGNPG